MARRTDCPAMTIVVDLGRKAKRNKTNKQNIHVKSLKTHAYSNTCINGHSQKDQKLFFRLIITGEHSAILSTFIKLPFVIKTFVLSMFEWPFYTGFTVHDY